MTRLTTTLTILSLALFAWTAPSQAQTARLLQPGCNNNPQPYVQPTQWQWYFGMNASLTNIGAFRGLQITYVVPGSPAARAGLEPGDMILSSNGTSFQNAWNSNQAVALLQQSVQPGFGGGIPTNQAGGVAAFVQPGAGSSAYGFAQLTVRNVRTGGLVSVMTQPQSNGFGGGVPTIALR